MLARLRARLIRAAADEDPKSPGPASRGGMPLGHASPCSLASSPGFTGWVPTATCSSVPLMRLMRGSGSYEVQLV